MLKEISYDDLKDHPLLLNIDRYTNKKGIKFYTQCTKIYEHGLISGVTFVAYPKYNNINNLITLKFDFMVSMQYIHSNESVMKNQSDFYYYYGIYEFRKYLDEIDEMVNSEHTFNVNTDNYTKPEIQNNRLISPIDYEEEERLDEIAEYLILKKYYFNENKNIIDEYSLKELVCVPEINFSRTYGNLKKRNFIDVQNYSLTKEGIAYFKNIDKSIININLYSKTVFVVQSLNSDIIEIYNKVYEPVIKKYNLKPILISIIEMDETIDNTILDQISQSRFIICDLTHSRPSVYFEAGYSTGKGLKVFYTCQSDHNSDDKRFNAEINKVHFDVRNRKITWWETDKLEEFKNALSERITLYLNSQNKKF